MIQGGLQIKEKELTLHDSSEQLFQKCILNGMRAITNSVMSHHHEKWTLHCVEK